MQAGHCVRLALRGLPQPVAQLRASLRLAVKWQVPAACLAPSLQNPRPSPKLSTSRAGTSCRMAITDLKEEGTEYVRKVSACPCWTSAVCQ